MSQTTTTTTPTGQQQRPPSRNGQQRGRGPPIYGRGPPGGQKNGGDRPRRPRRDQDEEVWVPNTDLGRRVSSGEITSIEEVIELGLRIQEAGIIKKLLPDLTNEVVDVGIIQKMTSNGQSTRFKAIVAAGDKNGYLGIGQGKSKQMRIAIEKATNQAFLNVGPVKMGCGSWECRCDQKHSVPFRVKGKGGSVTIEIIPAPRGLGLVAGGKIKRLLELAGLKDAWTTAKGSTPTMNSTSKAILDCLRQTFSQG
jgi:small subunit ribosomal protein S5